MAADDVRIRNDLKSMLAVKRVDGEVWPADRIREGITRDYASRAGGVLELLRRLGEGCARAERLAVDRGALILLAANTLALLVGFAVAWTARRRPRTVAALIGVAVAAGATAMGCAAAVVDAAGPRAGWACLVAGMLVVALGCPAWVLVVIARQRRGTAVGPAGVGEWVGMLAGYWFFCWVLVIIGSLVIHLGGTPHGQFR